MVRLEEQQRRPSQVASPLGRRPTLALLGGVLAVSALVFGLAVAGILAVPGGRDHALTVLAWTLPAHAVAVLALLHVGLRRAGSSWRGLGFTRPGAGLLHLVWQVPALLLLALSVQVSVSAVTGAQPPEDGGLEEVALAVDPGVLAAVLLSVVVLVPLWEEAVFRGLVLGGLRRRWPAVAAVLVTSAVFAAVHGVLVVVPYLFTLACGFAVLRRVHRTLWAPLLAHAANNAMASTALFALLVR